MRFRIAGADETAVFADPGKNVAQRRRRNRLIWIRSSSKEKNSAPHYINTYGEFFEMFHWEFLLVYGLIFTISSDKTQRLLPLNDLNESVDYLYLGNRPRKSNENIQLWPIQKPTVLLKPQLHTHISLLYSSNRYINYTTTFPINRMCHPQFLSFQESVPLSIHLFFDLIRPVVNNAAVPELGKPQRAGLDVLFKSYRILHTMASGRRLLLQGSDSIPLSYSYSVLVFFWWVPWPFSNAGTSLYSFLYSILHFRYGSSMSVYCVRNLGSLFYNPSNNRRQRLNLVWDQHSQMSLLQLIYSYPISLKKW